MCIVCPHRLIVARDLNAPESLPFVVALLQRLYKRPRQEHHPARVHIILLLVVVDAVAYQNIPESQRKTKNIEKCI